MEHKMTDTEAIRKFIYGGKAVFTIRSQTSGKHWSFSIRETKKKDGFFVFGLGYQQEFSYMGLIKHDRYHITANSQYSSDNERHLIIAHLLEYIRRGALHKKFEFFHEGKCGVCGRPLTDPESIERGLGPVCAKGAM